MRKKKNDIAYQSENSGSGQIKLLLFAIVSAVAAGISFKIFFGDLTETAAAVTEPLFSMILGIIRAVSSPMIFLTVCCGIISIGDLNIVGKIGKFLISRMIAGIFAVGLLISLIAGFIFRNALDSGDTAISGSFSDIYRIILDIVPSDIVTPFHEGNALQIIFLGIFFGTVILMLGDKVSNLSKLMLQINDTVRSMMEVLGKTMPLFVFLSIFDLLIFDFSSEISGLIKMFALIIAGCLAIMLFFLLALSVKYRINPFLLAKKMMPTFLIAFTTASSATALPNNLEVCEKSLGIPDKITNFTVPLGQVIYKPCAVIEYFIMVLCLAEYYKINISLTWLVTAFLIVCLLSIATPAVAGGAAAVFSVMFAQLGIPAEAIALAIALDSVIDFLVTAASITCLQANITLMTGRMDMLDVMRLKTNCSRKFLGTAVNE